MKKEFSFYTEYNQFYLEDAEVKREIDPSSFWNEEAFSSHLALEDGVIGVGTHSYGNIKGSIEMLDKPSDDIDYNLYDHIVEGSIMIQSGKIQVLNCPDSNVELALKIDPGKYRVRIYASNFDSVEETDLARDTDNDYYKIEIWKSENMERKVLKQWHPRL